MDFAQITKSNVASANFITYLIAPTWPMYTAALESDQPVFLPNQSKVRAEDYCENLITTWLSLFVLGYDRMEDSVQFDLYTQFDSFLSNQFKNV